MKAVKQFLSKALNSIYVQGEVFSDLQTIVSRHF